MRLFVVVMFAMKRTKVRNPRRSIYAQASGSCAAAPYIDCESVKVYARVKIEP